ncbi:MAG: hypothetical protein ACJAVI_000652 [Candidatus Azotimanducaceae bacterium]|jgi:hypothetical protein
MKSQNKINLKTLNQGSSTSTFYLKQSRIIILAGALLATTLSLSATAGESKRQHRMEQEINNEISRGVEARSHQRHRDQNSAQRQNKRFEKNQKQQSINREDREVREHSNKVTTAPQIKERVNQPQRQIHQLQQKQVKQHQKKQKHIQRGNTFVEKNHHSKRNDNNYSARHDDRRADRFNHRGIKNKRKSVTTKFAQHHSDHRRKDQRQYFKAKYRGAKHQNNRNRGFRNYRTFGHGAHQSLGLIYSYNAGNQYSAYRPDARFVWDKVKSFYTPTNRRGYEGEEVAIEINERVRTIQLKGKKRNLLIEAAYVEFGNGEVRRVPDFEGNLYSNDVINIRFRKHRFVTAIYLDVAANQGRRGKALISVLKAR